MCSCVSLVFFFFLICISLISKEGKQLYTFSLFTGIYYSPLKNSFRCFPSFFLLGFLSFLTCFHNIKNIYSESNPLSVYPLQILVGTVACLVIFLMISFSLVVKYT